MLLSHKSFLSLSLSLFLDMQGFRSCRSRCRIYSRSVIFNLHTKPHSLARSLNFFLKEVEDLLRRYANLVFILHSVCATKSSSLLFPSILSSFLWLWLLKEEEERRKSADPSFSSSFFPSHQSTPRPQPEPPQPPWLVAASATAAKQALTANTVFAIKRESG
jgi:hypothetical protein